ncbi:MAG: lactate racemase domain-containing protein [Spirochaetes bacterium]|jgi:hypothetical protein|nr:lactate racemase domain-containing protein [Spirochaetota bacterium]
MAIKKTIFCGNNFIEVDFPDNTRILSAPPHEDVLDDPRKATLEAIRKPIDHRPLKDLVKEGSTVLIAFDDLAVPVPPMAPGTDNRQYVIETVLDELYAAGVRRKDITLVCANGLHRMWKRSELASILGPRIMKEFSIGQIINHDGEDPEHLRHLGLTENGYDVEINSRVIDADLTIYVNVNWVPFNGGWKSTIIGLGTYKVIRHIHNNEIYLDEAPASCMEPKRNMLHARIWEMGRHLEAHLRGMGKKIFQIETAVNSKLPVEMSYVVAGDVEKVHERTLAYLEKHKTIDVEGQADILVFGVPDFMPYSMGTCINPVLIARMGLGYMFAIYENKPVVREGGIMVLANPCIDQCDPIHHPSYVELWEEGFKRSRDAAVLYDVFADEYANRPEFVHRYRFGYGFHGVHPVQAYCTTIFPKKHLSEIYVGGCTDNNVAEKLEWKPFAKVEDAITAAREKLGRDASVTFLSLPPFFLPRVH